MAETNAPGRTNYLSDESMSESGAEFGNALHEMGSTIKNKYPALSVFIGLVVAALFVYYGLENWELHPIIFTLLSILVFVISRLYLIALLITAAFIGIVGFIIVYLLSLM